MRSRVVRSITALAGVVLLTTSLSSCGFGFRREWKAAQEAPGSEDSIAGAWEGRWESTSTGHTGRLRAVIEEPVEAGSDAHPIHYRATWMKILSGGYRTEHQVQQIAPSSWTFTGEHELPGWAGGLYHYNGTVEGDQFEARYECELDTGTFRLTRVPSSQQP